MTINKNSDKEIANFDFLNSLDIDHDVKVRISQLLFMTLKGKSDALLTPIAKQNDPDVLLRSFDEVFKGQIHKMNSVLIDLELKNRGKFGPRSIQAPWKDRKSTVDSYFEPDNVRKPRLVLESKFGRLRPLSLDRASTYLKNDTNSGLPFFTRKSKVKEEALESFETLLKAKYPCLMFTRTQEQGKTRNVWGYPIADTLNEMRFYVPLLEYQRKMSSYRAAIISPKAVSLEITKYLKACENNGELVLLSIDFENYDGKFKAFMQDISFTYMKSLFQSSFRKDIDYIADRFGTIGLVTPDGIMYGKHILPSGSTLTNEIGSIGQFVAANSFASKVAILMQIQGDDGVYLLHKDDVEGFIKCMESCGLVVNRDKTYQSPVYCIYLQNLFHSEYKDKEGIISGIYPVYRALNRILFQERWSDFEDYEIEGKDYYSIRTISILENCRYHPLFEDLVKFVIKYDKYSLKVSESGLVNYVKMIERTSGKGGFINNQLGDDIKGIKSFATYKLVQNLIVSNNLG